MVELSSDIITELIFQLGRIGLWIQAIGLIIILWLVFQIIILINNRIKRKKLYSIEARLDEIENKIKKSLNLSLRLLDAQDAKKSSKAS